MLWKMLGSDIKRKKISIGITIVLIVICAFLVTEGVSMMIKTFAGTQKYLNDAAVADFHQEAYGSLAKDDFYAWAESREEIDLAEYSETKRFDITRLFVNDAAKELGQLKTQLVYIAEGNRLNRVLDMHNHEVSLLQNEIALPYTFADEYGICAGDEVSFGDGSTFVVKTLSRDCVWGSLNIGIKRVLVSRETFEKLNYGYTPAYSVSIKAADGANLNAIMSDFKLRFPQSQSFTRTAEEIRMNFININGVLASVMIVFSVLIFAVSLLCIQFIIKSSMEEDTVDIAGMKMIGIRSKEIQKMYLLKYIAITGMSFIVGFILMISMGNVMLDSLVKSTGNGNLDIWGWLVLLSVLAVFLGTVAAFCLLHLKKINHMSAIEAMRMGSSESNYKAGGGMRLSKREHMPFAVFSGIKAILSAPVNYILIFFIFLICAITVVIPFNLKNTLTPAGMIDNIIPDCDSVICQTVHTEAQEALLKRLLKEDGRIKDYSISNEFYNDVLSRDGYLVTTNITYGVYDKFHHLYVKGTYPKNYGEAALGSFAEKSLGLGVGDYLTVVKDGQKYSYLITGVYSSIIEGGNSVKIYGSAPLYGSFSYIYINLNPGTDIDAFHADMKAAYGNLDIMKRLDVYTFFHVNSITDTSLPLVIGCILVSCAVLILVTALFLNLQIKKDVREIAVQKTLGIRNLNLQTQYFISMFTILAVGLLIGIFIGNSVGGVFMNFVMTLAGAAKIDLLIKPWEVYCIVPLVLLGIVAITSYLSTLSVRKISTSRLNQE